MIKGEKQKIAYENRDAILPGDKLYITCTFAELKYAKFRMEDAVLTVEQDERKPLFEGDKVELYCYRQIVAANRLGLFVDYEFGFGGWFGKTVRINGPDAQNLEVIEKAWGR